MVSGSAKGDPLIQAVSFIWEVFFEVTTGGKPCVAARQLAT